MAKRKQIPPLTDSQLDTLTSYPDGDLKVRRELNITHLQLTELALNANIEQCPSCKWWCESGELIPTDSDEPDGHCSNCRMGESV